MGAPVPRTIAERLLRRGDALVQDKATGTWGLAIDGRLLSDADARELLADKRLALRPVGDQLPGFPPACSQSWARRKRVRTRPSRTRAEPAAVQTEAP